MDLSNLDDIFRGNIGDFGDSIDERTAKAQVPSTIGGEREGNFARFDDWYSGPGGESATKIGLALIAMFGPGAALFSGIGGGGGGEGAAGGGAGGGGGSGSWIQQAMRGGQGMLNNSGGDESSGPEYSLRKRRGIFGSDSGPLFNV